MHRLICVIIFVFIMGLSPSARTSVIGDVDDDGKIGLTEAVYALQIVAGVREAIAGDDKIIVSDSTLAKGGEYTFIYFVPQGKVFILTDIYATPLSSNGTSFTFYENMAYKFQWTFNNTLETHLTSGIPFMSGSNITVYAQLSDIIIRFSGFLTSSAPYEKMLMYGK